MIVKTIKLDFDDELIELTIEQALALRDELNRLFGTKDIQYVPYVPYVPPTWPGIWYSKTSNNMTYIAWQSS
jgi:hypothetical protein